jgi:hypothetical protein
VQQGFGRKPYRGHRTHNTCGAVLSKKGAKLRRRYNELRHEMNAAANYTSSPRRRPGPSGVAHHLAITSSRRWTPACAGATVFRYSSEFCTQNCQNCAAGIWIHTQTPRRLPGKGRGPPRSKRVVHKSRVTSHAPPHTPHVPPAPSHAPLFSRFSSNSSPPRSPHQPRRRALTQRARSSPALVA